MIEKKIATSDEIFTESIFKKKNEIF